MSNGEIDNDEVVEIDGVVIHCVSCKVDFVFGGGEREFFKEKGLRDPKRCGPCRRARKEGRQYEAKEEPEDPDEEEE